MACYKEYTFDLLMKVVLMWLPDDRIIIKGTLANSILVVTDEYIIIMFVCLLVIVSVIVVGGDGGRAHVRHR